MNIYPTPLGYVFLKINFKASESSNYNAILTDFDQYFRLDNYIYRRERDQDAYF